MVRCIYLAFPKDNAFLSIGVAIRIYWMVSIKKIKRGERERWTRTHEIDEHKNRKKKLVSKSLELLLFIAVAELFYANQKSLVFFASDVKISNF